MPVAILSASIVGLVEAAGAYATRDELTVSEIAAFMPTSKGQFCFPSPYNSMAWRITDSTDRGGDVDNVQGSGYSYWRQMNNHVGSAVIKILVTIDGTLTLFELNKNTGVVTNEGVAINAGQAFSGVSGENIYWSGTDPDKFYLPYAEHLVRYDHVLNTYENVVDVTAHSISGASYAWQPSSSDDDNWHAMIVRDVGDADLGSLRYDEGGDTVTYVAEVGTLDEPQISRSGNYLSIKDNEDSLEGEDCRIIKTSDSSSRFVNDTDGAPGHSDWGYDWIAYNDNYATEANTVVTWDATLETLTDVIQYYNADWTVEAPAHISAQGGTGAITGKIICGSSCNAVNSPHSNEIIIVKMDATRSVLVACPTMTDVTAGKGDGFGGTAGLYEKRPKANLDVTGEYFFFTSNLQGDYLDAFVVKIPDWA